MVLRQKKWIGSLLELYKYVFTWFVQDSVGPLVADYSSAKNWWISRNFKNFKEQLAADFFNRPSKVTRVIFNSPNNREQFYNPFGQMVQEISYFKFKVSTHVVWWTSEWKCTCGAKTHIGMSRIHELFS